MKRLLIGGLAAFAIGLTGCSITGGAPAHTKPVVATVAIAPTAPATLASPVSAPTGSAVRDGRFEFHVGRVERLKTVGDPTGNPYMTATAQGEFIVVTMSVTNIGNQAQS